jgi:Zn finger protein HypA/HybF involved in hydrogenase expression
MNLPPQQQQQQQQEIQTLSSGCNKCKSAATKLVKDSQMPTDDW